MEERRARERETVQEKRWRNKRVMEQESWYVVAMATTSHLNHRYSAGVKSVKCVSEIIQIWKLGNDRFPQSNLQQSAHFSNETVSKNIFSTHMLARPHHPPALRRLAPRCILARNRVWDASGPSPVGIKHSFFCATADLLFKCAQFAKNVIIWMSGGRGEGRFVF